MKIAYIYDAVYPWVKGGAEKRIYEIGKRLSEKGMRFTGMRLYVGR